VCLNLKLAARLDLDEMGASLPSFSSFCVDLACHPIPNPIS
jgi:hypothetical protein